ncbi:gag-pol polyprotein [Tanacetum coccineum]
MTRSSTNKLFTPYKEPEREFRSSRRHFKSLSLDELRSPDFNLFSDQEYSEEEEAEAMAETMEQYMSKTRTDYGSGVARPKIKEKDSFELKGQFLKELRENTFSVRIIGAHSTKTTAGSKKPSKKWQNTQKWHNGTSKGRSIKTSDGLAAIQAQLNNLGREIKKVNEKVYATQVGCEQCKEAYSKASQIDESIPQKEKDPGSFTLHCFINNVCFDNSLVDLGASVSIKPLLTYLNLGLGKLAHTKLTVELADRTVKYPKGIAENVLVRIGKFTFPVDFIILDMPEDIKVPLILGRPFLSTARAKIDVNKRKITLRVGEENIIFKSVKFASSLIKRVYMLSLREIIELDLEARLMGETLVLNRLLDPFLEDYIELNDLNETFWSLRKSRALMNVPIFVETFSVVTDFAILEDMDAYREDGMGEVIVGEPFLSEVGIKARRFDYHLTMDSDAFSAHNLAHKRNLENLPSKYQRVSHSNSF